MKSISRCNGYNLLDRLCTMIVIKQKTPNNSRPPIRCNSSIRELDSGFCRKFKNQTGRATGMSRFFRSLFEVAYASRVVFVISTGKDRKINRKQQPLS